MNVNALIRLLLLVPLAVSISPIWAQVQITLTEEAGGGTTIGLSGSIQNATPAAANFGVDIPGNTFSGDTTIGFDFSGAVRTNNTGSGPFNSTPLMGVGDLGGTVAVDAASSFLTFNSTARLLIGLGGIGTGFQAGETVTFSGSTSVPAFQFSNFNLGAAATSTLAGFAPADSFGLPIGAVANDSYRVVFVPLVGAQVVVGVAVPVVAPRSTGDENAAQPRPVFVLVTEPTPQSDPEPITIIDIGAQQSAGTTGQATINAVNQGTAGTFSSFSNNVGSHIDGLTGFGGFGGTNFAVFRRATTNQRLNMQIAGTPGRINSGSITAGVVSEPVAVDTFIPQWELYTMGAFNRQDQDQIGADPGFLSDAWSGTIGIERFVGKHILIGLATTLGRNAIEAGGNSGAADIDGVVVDAYGVYSKDHFWTSLRYGWGNMDIDVTRNAFPGLTARANTESENSVISWGAGLNLPLNLFGMEFLHGPNLGLDYTSGTIDGYTESGANAFNLIVNEHSYGSLISEVGWTLAKAHDLGKFGRGFLQLRAGWEHEHLLDESNTEFQFETSPISTLDPATGSITEGPPVFGAGHNPTPQNDYATIGLHLTQLLGAQERWVLRSGYQTQLFRSDFSEHYGYLRLGFQF